MNAYELMVAMFEKLDADAKKPRSPMVLSQEDAEIINAALNRQREEK